MIPLLANGAPCGQDARFGKQHVASLCSSASRASRMVRRSSPSSSPVSCSKHTVSVVDKKNKCKARALCACAVPSVLLAQRSLRITQKKQSSAAVVEGALPGVAATKSERLHSRRPTS